jgi:hypothetical protein
MRFMVMVKATEASETGQLPSAELVAEMGAFNEKLVKAGVMEAGEGLHPSSKGARIRYRAKERFVTDGPFAETKELIAGFWILNVASKEEAIEWLKQAPNPFPEGDSWVEIRQIYAPEDFLATVDPTGELMQREAKLREEIAAKT